MLGAGRLRSAGAIGGEDAFGGGEAKGGDEAFGFDETATFALFVSGSEDETSSAGRFCGKLEPVRVTGSDCLRGDVAGARIDIFLGSGDCVVDVTVVDGFWVDPASFLATVVLAGGGCLC